MTAAGQVLIAARGWWALRWQPMVASWVLAVALLGWRIGSVTDAAGAVDLLRGMAVLLALGALFVLDDEALNVVAAAPVSLAVRTAMRTTVAVAGSAAAWLPALVLIEARAGIRVPAAMSIELAALLACGLAVAAVAQRHFDLPEPSVAAGPAVIAILLGLGSMPKRWALFVPPDAGWIGAHLRWTLVLGVAGFVLLASVRDPAAGRPRARATPVMS
jgi:fluoroquinolone transport system permease protein